MGGNQGLLSLLLRGGNRGSGAVTSGGANAGIQGLLGRGGLQGIGGRAGLRGIINSMAGRFNGGGGGGGAGAAGGAGAVPSATLSPEFVQSFLNKYNIRLPSTQAPAAAATPSTVAATEATTTAKVSLPQLPARFSNTPTKSPSFAAPQVSQNYNYNQDNQGYPGYYNNYGGYANPYGNQQAYSGNQQAYQGGNQG